MNVYELSVLSERKKLVDDMGYYVAQHYPEKFNIFIFGSFLTEDFIYGKSDLDLAIYTEGRFMDIDELIDDFLKPIGIKYDTIPINPNSSENLIDIAPLTGYRVTEWFPETLKEHLSRLVFRRQYLYEDLIKYNSMYKETLKK